MPAKLNHSVSTEMSLLLLHTWLQLTFLTVWLSLWCCYKVFGVSDFSWHTYIGWMVGCAVDFRGLHNNADHRLRMILNTWHLRNLATCLTLLPSLSCVSFSQQVSLVLWCLLIPHACLPNSHPVEADGPRSWVSFCYKFSPVKRDISSPLSSHACSGQGICWGIWVIWIYFKFDLIGLGL